MAVVTITGHDPWESISWNVGGPFGWALPTDYEAMVIQGWVVTRPVNFSQFVTRTLEVECGDPLAKPVNVKKNFQGTLADFCQEYLPKNIVVYSSGGIEKSPYLRWGKVAESQVFVKDGEWDMVELLVSLFSQTPLVVGMTLNCSCATELGYEIDPAPPSTKTDKLPQFKLGLIPRHPPLVTIQLWPAPVIDVD